jgi:hypothetical protein
MTLFPLMMMPTPDRAPPHWTGAWVRGRLREAYEIERRLPGTGRRSNGGWPQVLHSFADMVGWPDARERVWAGWARAKGAYPWEISRMEEAFGWLAILIDWPGERRCLVLWAKTNGSIRAALRRRRWPRATFYRGVVSASERIARVLNTQGVKVR